MTSRDSSSGEGTKVPATEDRESFIVDTLVSSFSDLTKADPDAFRTKFRKMGRRPVRVLPRQRVYLYADVGAREDRWADERTGVYGMRRVFAASTMTNATR
jgi:hypothetical protein